MLYEKKLKAQHKITKAHNQEMTNYRKTAELNFRKFQKQINNAEEIVDYLLFVNDRNIDLLEKVLENSYLGNNLDLKEYSEKNKSEEQMQELEISVKAISHSKFLRTKKLFLNIKDKIRKVTTFKFDELQMKFDKLLTKDGEIIKKYQENQFKVENPNLEGREKEMIFDRRYHEFLNSVMIIKNLLEEKFFVCFKKEKIMTLVDMIKQVLDSVEEYMEDYRDKIVVKNIKKEKNGKEDFADFNKNIDILYKKLEELENVEYEKLNSLRDKNNDLEIIKNHIQNLSKENEELIRKMTECEFDLLEQNAIILSYERNIEQKNNLLKIKNKKIEVLTEKSKDLNEKISESIINLIDTENSINKLTLQIKDNTERLQKTQKDFVIKSDILTELTKQVTNQDFIFKNQDKEKSEINKKISDYELKILDFEKNHSKSEAELFSLEKSIRNKMSIFVKNKYDEELNLKNINFFNSSSY